VFTPGLNAPDGSTYAIWLRRAKVRVDRVTRVQEWEPLADGRRYEVPEAVTFVQFSEVVRYKKWWVFCGCDDAGAISPWPLYQALSTWRHRLRDNNSCTVVKPVCLVPVGRRRKV